MKKMINRYIQFLFYTLSFSLVVSVTFVPSIVVAQDAYPREYTNPDEIVAFDKNTLYVEAIEVINQFQQEYDNKFIIDQTATDGSIGVNLPAMHWKDALAFILRIKGLGVKEFDDYVEIVPQSSLEPATESTVTTSNPNNPNSAFEEISINTREVRINATFFEGNKRALQEIGIDWSTLTKSVPTNINDIVSGEAVDPGLSAPQGGAYTDQFVSVNSFNASSVSQNVFNALVNFGEIGPGIRVQALFSAFEADNLGEVIANPSVKVVDGQQGRIQVGQDFSIKQRDIAGNVTDQFFSTGTILTVTPRVIDNYDTTFIHLDIAVERSSASPDAVSTIINKQEAQTQALLLDGEATSIAGLYRTEENEVRRGVPILKDLPGWFFGLKYLFGYNSQDYVENELIIIVQAEIEQTLQERISEAGRSFKTRREVLSETREGHRTALDEQFENPFAQILPAASTEDTLGIDTDKALLSTEIDSNTVQIESEPPVVFNTTDDDSMEIVTDDTPEELTKEQKQLAEELSIPIDNPELMIVVPRAFSLDDYLVQKDTNPEVQESESEVNDLKFFIIGASFLVQSNADRFHKGLLDNGYESNILFHPESRFNYVSYKGFSSFEEAVDYLKFVRTDTNSEAWLFSKPN